jgi:hypothetical protein
VNTHVQLQSLYEQFNHTLLKKNQTIQQYIYKFNKINSTELILSETNSTLIKLNHAFLVIYLNFISISELSII